MKKSLLAGLTAVATSTAIVGVLAPPASANDTIVTFTLAGGALGVTAPATAALTDGNSGSTSIAGSLGETVLTDNRGGTAGWSVGASSTVFGNGTTNASAVSYNSGLPLSTGVVVATSSGATTLSTTPAEVVAGTVVVGNNTATWNPTITVTLPASSTTGDYSGTITTSVL